VADHLHNDGYEMASLKGVLTPDGALTLDVDEGRIGSVELFGVAREVEPGVRRRLGLEPGHVFFAPDLENGLKRLKDEYPFLRRDDQERWTRAQPELIVERDAAEGIRFHTAETRCPDSGSFTTPQPGCNHPNSYYSIDGGRLAVHLKARRGDSTLRLDAADLLRHTRVTGYSPGFAFETRVFDPRDRVHFGLATGLAFNTDRPNRDVPGADFFESMSAHERLDWYVAPRIRVPALRIAELGVQLHAFTDSSDFWRRAPLDVSLSSLFGTGSGVDFYRRAGLASFVTWRVESFTAGVEYRLDRYDSMPTREGQVENPPVDAGEMGSLLFRAEWSSEYEEGRIANPARNPETRLFAESLFGRPGPMRTGFRTLNTLETAQPGLGGDARFDFTRFVSDNVLTLAVSEHHGLLLRMRAGGGKNLPLQKQEALGGWSALRGYDFKEFRGDYSLLAMAEYRFEWVSAFADLGSVRSGGAWSSAKVGLGVALNGGDWAQLAFAWRTDGRSQSSPQIRLIFLRAF
jgi:hypothetical protein